MNSNSTTLHGRHNDDKCPSCGRYAPCPENGWTGPDWESPFTYPFRVYCNSVCDAVYAAKYPIQVSEWERIECSTP